MKNRSIIGILCIILAVAVTFAVSPLINKVTEGKTEVIQLTGNVRQGEQITNEMVKTVKIGSFGVDPKVIKSTDEMVGKYAAANLFADTNLTAEMFILNADSPEDIFNNLKADEYAISVSIPSLASGLSGKLRQGDIVSAIVVTERGGEILPELKYLKVITTTSSSGMDTNQGNLEQGELQNLPATVTLLANEAQSKLLAFYDQTSKIHLSLVYRGEKSQAEKYLTAQKEYFENINSERESEEDDG